MKTVTRSIGSTDSSRKAQLNDFEPYARKGLVGLAIAMGGLLVGQYTGAAAVSSAFQQDHMKAWASRSPAHAAAIAEFQRCEVTPGPALTHHDCALRAAKGSMAAELEDLMFTPKAAWQSVPAPLRWFMY